MKNNLAKLYLKYKLIIYPVLVLLAGVFLILLVIYPQASSFLKGQEDVGATELKIKNLEAKASELQNIQDEDLKVKLQYATVALPPDKDYTGVIGLLQRLGAEAGVSIKSVNLEGSGVKDVGGVSSFAVRVEVFANRLALNEFLEKVQKASLLMKVMNLSVERAGSAEAIKAVVLIEIYYSPTPNNLGSVDTPLPKLSPEEEQLAEKLVANSSFSPAVNVVTSSGSASTQPVNILPRGKANPFE